MYCNEPVRRTCLRTHGNCLSRPLYVALNSEINGKCIVNLQAVHDLFSGAFFLLALNSI